MNIHLPIGGVIKNCVFIALTCNCAIADTIFTNTLLNTSNPAITTPLSAKVLAQVSNPPIMEDILKKQEASPSLPSPSVPDDLQMEPQKISVPTTPSKLSSIVNKAKYLTEGAGMLGDNVSTVVKRNIVGIQYTMQW